MADSGVDSATLPWPAPRPDPELDPGLDQGLDGGLDQGLDCALDQSPDDGLDHGLDHSADPRMDPGSDPDVNIGVDLGVSIGVDLGVSIGVDPGVANGVEIGVDSSQPIDADEITGWALAARAGDPVAAAAFIRATQAEVWRFVAALVDQASADDLTQETYLRAFRALPSFQARATARTWVLGIARRVCADHIRTLVRTRRLVNRLATVEPAAQSQPVDLSATLAATELIKRLGTAHREAFVLTQVLGLSYHEAASTLGVPIGTIRSRVARARSELLASVQQSLAV